MWGEGYILPTSCAFERQFEPMGKAEDGEADYYLYRRNLEGRAVKLTPHDYRETVAMFFWSVVRRWFWTVLIYGVSLGGVDKFEPVSGGGEMDHSEEAVGQLIVAGGDGAVDLELSEHALDAIALLVERPIMLDFHAAV